MIQDYGTISCFMELDDSVTYEQIITAINNFREQTYYYKELVIINVKDDKRLIEYISNKSKNYKVYDTIGDNIASSTFNGNIILCKNGDITLTSGKYFVHWTPYQWSNPSRLFFQAKYLHDNKMDICHFSKVYTYNDDIEDSIEYENTKKGKYLKEILMADRVKYIKNKISQENFIGGDDQKYYIYIKNHTVEPSQTQQQQQSYFNIFLIFVIVCIILLALYFIFRNSF